MELRIATEELLKALHRAQGIAERKTTIPILANVLLRTTDNGITLTAFDLEIGVVSEHPAEVMKEGAITLSAKHLYDIAKVLPESQVTLKRVSNNAVEISSGTAHFKLIGMPAEDYPALPKEEKASLVKADGRTLLEMIQKTQFAISTDETRYILNGVYFETREQNRVRMVATDGHRLSLIERGMEGDFKLKKGVIIPRKGLMELKRLLEEDREAECFLGFAESSAVFRKAGLSMFMRLMDGQFPDYEQVIPRPGENPLELGRKNLLDTLKRISLLSEEKSHAVRMGLQEGLLKVSSQNPDLGEAREELQVGYKGKAINVGFNARYLIDVLNVIESEDVTFELADEQSPGVMRPASDSSYTAVVMPMRI